MKDQKINKNSPKILKAKLQVYLCPILFFVLPHSPSLDVPSHITAALTLHQKENFNFSPKMLEEAFLESINMRTGSLCCFSMLYLIPIPLSDVPGSSSSFP